MTEIEIDAGTLEFSEADRTATGLLVPFGEECRSNLGRFTVDTGSFALPSDVTGMSLNLEHAREEIVGAISKVSESAKGIVATFGFADTPEGRQAFQDAQSGKRKHLSAEVAEVVIRGGKAVAGRLFAAALVRRPAFPSATLLAAADDTAPDPAEGPQPLEPDAEGDIAIQATQTPATVTVTAGEIETVFTPEGDNTDKGEGDVTVPNTLTAASGTEAKKSLDKRGFLALLAARANGTADADARDRLNAALTTSDTLFAAGTEPTLTHVDHSGANAAEVFDPSPQWIGEVFNGVPFQPVVSDLVGHADLTSRKVAGYKVTTKPTGGTWAGNGATVTSTGMKTTATSDTAAYFAGGDSVGREFFDFGVDAALLEAYFSAQVEAYREWTDDGVLSAIKPAAATAADDPSGLTIGAGWSALIDGATQVISQKGGVPTFAIVEPSLYKSMLKVPAQNVLGYLAAALGLEEGQLGSFTIRPDGRGKLATGNILVGNGKVGATLYELPGTPVRAQALNVAIGSVDVALFGYALPKLNSDKAFALIAPHA